MLKKTFLSRKILLAALGLIVGVEAAFAAGWVLPSQLVPEKAVISQVFSEQDHAQHIVEKCASAPYKPTCYEDEVTRLMDTLSMEQAFTVTGHIQDLDPSYRYCHVLAHKLSALETKKNLNAWMDIIPRCPSSGMCANGCLHGSLQERFKSEVLSDAQLLDLGRDLKIACEPRSPWSPTPLQQAVCYHGLGHLLVYATGANLQKALSICDSFASEDVEKKVQLVCYDGAFMQIFQPIDADDVALVVGKQPTKETLQVYCSQFDSEKKRASCWVQGSIFYREEIKTSQGILSFCAATPGNLQSFCYLMMFHTAAEISNFDHEAIWRICSTMPAHLQGRCFGDMAGSYIHSDDRYTDAAFSFCKKDALAVGAASGCYDQLVLYAPQLFHKDSNGYENFCRRFMDPWKTLCLEKRVASLPIF